jgi:hypothetical protein
MDLMRPESYSLKYLLQCAERAARAADVRSTRLARPVYVKYVEISLTQFIDVLGEHVRLALERRRCS